ncbi:MAG: hypothetical protein IT383_13085 [Deltaproteobacteria bacterium]|nr:hypothetical protein [Deltaproteobacteria bacterium]
MRGPSVALLLMVIAHLAACPPDWDSLPFPDAGPGEGEGEGEGDVCAGSLDEQGLWHVAPGIGNIVDMIHDEGDRLIATTEEGVIAVLDVDGVVTSLGQCPGTPGQGQLLRASTGVLIRTGDNQLCALAPGGEEAQQVQVSAGGPADLSVGGAILVDGSVTTVLVAYGIDDTTLALATYEVTSDGLLASQGNQVAVTSAGTAARLERVGDDDRVAVVTIQGAIYEATLSDSGDIDLAFLGQLDETAWQAQVALGRPSASGTPVVVSVAGEHSDVKVRTGVWEDGPQLWAPVARSDRFRLADDDLPAGVLLSSGGCVVHYGDYGYLGVQATTTAAMEPASGTFRAKDLQRLARGVSDGSLWALTTTGGVGRWDSDEPFCVGPLSPPAYALALPAPSSGAILPLADGAALIPLTAGLARVAVPFPATPDVAFAGRAVKAVFLDDTSAAVLVVFASGTARRMDPNNLNPLGTELSLGVTPAGAEEVERLDTIAVVVDPLNPAANLFWVAAIESGTRVLQRCTWSATSEPSCALAATIPAGPQELIPANDRIGGLGVVGDAIVVLMSSGVRVAQLDAPHDTLLDWDAGVLELPPSPEEFFTHSLIGAELHAFSSTCTLVAGFGPRLQRLGVAYGTEFLESADAVDRDPYQSTLIPVCDGTTILSTGGRGATFYARTFDPATCTLGEPNVLGPDRPKDRVSAAAEAGGYVWVAEGTELWQLPAP